MKRKTIKAKIAAALSASMVATVLAPAMPAMAATPGPDANGFKIDFRSKNEAKVPFVKDLFISGGTAGGTIAADYKGMKYEGTDQVLYLPYLDTTGAFVEANAPTASLDAPGTEAAQSWATDLGLDGYNRLCGCSCKRKKYKGGKPCKIPDDRFNLLCNIGT